MKYLKQIRLVTAGLVTALFLVHLVLMTLLLQGLIHYHSSYKYMGIALIVAMVFHVILCGVSFITKQEREKKFYGLKWITGLLMILAMTVHGDDYVKEINLLGIHINKGMTVVGIEVVLLIICVLHIRINIGPICNHFDMGEKKKLIISRISCGIATVLILIPSITIINYFF